MSKFGMTGKAPYSPFGEAGGAAGGLTLSTQVDNAIADSGTLTVTGQGVTQVDFRLYDYSPDGSTNSSTTDAVPTMTGNTTPSGEVTYFASVAAGGLATYGCFSDSSTEWAGMVGASIGDGWYAYEFSSAVPINKFSMTSRNTYTEQAPKDFKIQGSNDGVSWTDLQSYTGETAWGNVETRWFTLTNETSYLHYRIYFTDNNGASSDSNYYYGLREIQFVETQRYTSGPNFSWITQNPSSGSYGVSDPGGSGNRTITVTNNSGSTEDIQTTYAAE